MDTIELMEPQIEYADEIWQFRQEIIDCDADKEDRFAGCFLLDTSASAEEWIDQCRHRKSENTCGAAEGMVPSHTYMGVRKSDNKVIGIIDLRHHTCDAANLPSEKTIVACGGVFEKTVAVDGRMIKRYWIAVTEKEVF